MEHGLEQVLAGGKVFRGSQLVEPVLQCPQKFYVVIGFESRRVDLLAQSAEGRAVGGLR